MNREEKFLSKKVLWLMTFGAGLVVANNYYSQPLLAQIAKDFGVSDSEASKLPMFTQIGYAMGLLLMLPLGDMFRRKRIIVVDFLFIIMALLLTAYSPSIEIALLASFMTGFTSVIPQMFVPIAAQLSSPKDRPANIALVMSGLLIGILLSRVFSGWIGEYHGWRSVYLIATLIVFVLWLLIIKVLPDVAATFKGSYIKLLRSMLDLFWKNGSLRLASIRGGLGFAAFFAFWTPLSFHLERAPFFAGSEIAGRLGLVAVVGALAAIFAGKLANKVNQNHLITVALLIMLLSWGIFGMAGYTYLGLILGIIFIDMGLQAMHITNQTIVFSIQPEAANRLNTIYMVIYFIGGASGTYLGGKAWEAYQWNGVVVVGAAFVVAALLIHLLFSKIKLRK